ncbi:Sialidase-4 [Myotis davidii]|uniref:exo-alpha-sialidase n=1 Tax=Myotis davidii TaxID=225400 RepID=L5M343_MYODS|nr:Sialidase-4 [Myotis davidii]
MIRTGGSRSLEHWELRTWPLPSPRRGKLFQSDFSATEQGTQQAFLVPWLVRRTLYTVLPPGDLSSLGKPGPVKTDWATFAVGPGHGIQLRSGRLLVPAYTYHVDRRECFGKICRTSPHAFTFYSDDHGQTWRHGGLLSNLRSGECQLAVVDGGRAGSVLYCNARSPLGSRVQALSTDEGTSFLPGELVPTLAETARGCQGSILGFPAPHSNRPGDEGWSPLDPHSWTEPWVIYQGPSGYSDLASIGPTPEGSLTFACLYESGTRVSYEEISFCVFSLREVLENVLPGPEPTGLGNKPWEQCWPS